MRPERHTRPFVFDISVGIKHQVDDYLAALQVLVCCRTDRRLLSLYL